MPQLHINGRLVETRSPSETPLLWVLRDELGLTGAKYGCGIGACGACTVHRDGVAVRSCTLRVGDVGAAEITTIEGLAGDGLHPVQQAWIDEDVPQCGYCQAGQIMTAAAALRGASSGSEPSAAAGTETGAAGGAGTAAGPGTQAGSGSGAGSGARAGVEAGGSTSADLEAPGFPRGRGPRPSPHPDADAETLADLERALAGVLCRCGTYARIRRAAARAVELAREAR